MTKPVFTAEDLQNFATYHVEASTGIVLSVRGEPELLSELNDRVAPLMTALEALANFKGGSATRTYAEKAYAVIAAYRNLTERK